MYRGQEKHNASKMFAVLLGCSVFLTGFTVNAEKFHIKQYIVSQDVLRPEEKISFDLEAGLNARFFLLNADSELTDLGRNYPIELAATGSCLNEMETLNRCLSNRKERSNEKLSVTTQNVSKARKLGIMQIETVDSSGDKFLIDEDCTNNQIDLEECIVRSNRFFPCAPPERDLSKSRKLFVERSQKFSTILPTIGYELIPATLQFEFGDLPSFEILNYDYKYEGHAKTFLESLPEKKLLPAFENFKNDFLALKKVAPKNSKRFYKFEKALKSAACKKEVLELPEMLENVNAKIVVMMKKFEGANLELENIQKAIPMFFQQFPKEVPEKCDEKYQKHVENKISVIEALQWECKQMKQV